MICLLPLVALLCLPVWLYWAVGVVGLPRSSDVGREVRRALMLGAVPATGAALGAGFAVTADPALRAGLREGPLLPLWAMAGLSAGGVVLLLALYLRLRRPPAHEKAARRLYPADRLFPIWVAGALLAIAVPAAGLGLWNGTEWLLPGGLLGLFLALPLLTAQRAVYAHLARRSDPPSRRALVAAAVGPLVLGAAALLAWLAYQRQPDVRLASLLGEPVAGASDVRLEDRRVDYSLLFGLELSSWHLSFEAAPDAVARLAASRGFVRVTPSPNARVEYVRPRDEPYWHEKLWIDATTSRVHYESATGPEAW